jgi:arylamine N-acetyltransferase
MEVSESTVADTAPKDMTPPSTDWVRRYLSLLSVEAEPPSYQALARLVRAHLETVPFENVSSLIRAAAAGAGPIPPLDLDAQLVGWEERCAGGICFEVTNTFTRLLVGLGYQAAPLLAQISFPGSHSAILVQLNGERYLIDVANGAPFWQPVPLMGEFSLQHAGLSYRFRPGESPDEWVQERGIGRAWRPFCTYNLCPAGADAREVAYQRHHIPGESFVATELVLIRCQEDTVSVFRDGLFTQHSAAGKHSRRVSDPDEIERLACDVFRLPGLPVRDGIAAHTELTKRRHS